jgi:hypothetical protein
MALERQHRRNEVIVKTMLVNVHLIREIWKLALYYRWVDGFIFLHAFYHRWVFDNDSFARMHLGDFRKSG